MAIVVGVRFKRAGKAYYFDPSGIELSVNDQVVVETARGLEIGQVSIAPREVPDTEITEPLKPVVRKATPEDTKRCEELEAKEKEAISECAKLIEKLNLPMKLLGADYNLDGNHLTFYFSSVERVDFRELVRELARRLKVRVEMRQTGPRDEARLCGGCGRCGRPLCCATFLSEFTPVAMKMAKEQGLPLNPMKISGVCGRLMCCLGYENDQYREMKTTLPRNGQWVTTSSGLAKVIGSNPLKQTVQVILETDAIIELPVGEITLAERPPERQRVPVSREPDTEKPARKQDARTNRADKNQTTNAPRITESQDTVIEDQETETGK